MPDFAALARIPLRGMALDWRRRLAACAAAGLLACSSLAEPLIDPTAPARMPARTEGPGSRPVTAPVRAPLQLQGVWLRGGDRVAMVNGARVRAGDRVEGRRVLAVLGDGVQVRGEDGRTETLRLQPRVRARASELLPAGEGELAVRR